MSGTASVGGAYTPPFAQPASATASLSFASVASPTATKTASGGAKLATSFASCISFAALLLGPCAHPACSPSPADTPAPSSQVDVFTKPYITAHTLSQPSWRYAYCLYVLTFGVLVLWSIGSRLGGSGPLGATFRKVGIRRFIFSGFGRAQRKPKASAHIDEKSAAGGPASVGPRRITWASPTFAQLLVVAGFIAVAAVLSFTGDDYIDPNECVFGGDCPQSYSNSPTSDSIASGALDNGWTAYTDPLLSSSNVAIHQNTWTASARLGLISYALLPLSVTLALKQWPFNIWAAPFLTNYGFDKTAILHRWSGRIIWLFASGHTFGWFYQLCQDRDPYGRLVVLDVWAYYRFVAGAVAYVLLSVLVLFSFSWFRNRYYEFFYWSHVGLVIVFMVACIIHHAPLMAWPITGLCWWAGERLCRFVVFAWVNGLDRSLRPSNALDGGAGSNSKRGSFVVLGAEKVNRESNVTERDWHSGESYPPSHDYSAPQPPAGASARTGVLERRNTHKKRSLFAFGPGQNRDYIKNLEKSALPAAAQPPTPLSPNFVDESGMALSAALRTLPAPGYARAQLLPGRTVRLTIHTPRAVRWLPGQHCFLTIPEVGRFQAHPYTIAGIDERAYGILPLGGHVMLPSQGSELVLIIRAQKGFSKELWEYVERERRRRQAERGIELRALVSWPLGSAGRVNWDEHDSVLIVCGGTGVTFGISVLEYACRRMARNASTRGGPSSAYRTKRVRFVWILREFAHLSWVAPTLRRCLDLSDPSQLQVDLYVSRNVPKPVRPSRPGSSLGHLAAQQGAGSAANLLPPVAPFLKSSQQRQHRRGSHSSIDSSDGSDLDEFETPPPSAGLYPPTQRRQQQLDLKAVEAGLVDPGSVGQAGADESVTDWILFDGEDEAQPTRGEQIVSAKVMSEGKVRRALSRRQQGISFRRSKAGVGGQKRASALEGDVITFDSPPRRTTALPTVPGSPPRAHTPSLAYEHSNASFNDGLSDSGRPNSFIGNESLAASQRGLLSDLTSESRPGLTASSSMATLINASGTGIKERAGSADEDAFLDLTEEEHDDLDAVSELARPGHPNLPAIFREELDRGEGKMMVACCGPNSLNTMVRHLVSDGIDLRKTWRGDRRGQISLVCEDFAF